MSAMRLKLSLLHIPGHVLRVIRQKHAKNRWQRKSAITYACAPAVILTPGLTIGRQGGETGRGQQGGGNRKEDSQGEGQ